MWSCLPPPNDAASPVRACAIPDCVSKRDPLALARKPRSLVFGPGQELSPLLHEHPPPLEQIRPPVGRLDGVRVYMGQHQLAHLPRRVRALRRPVPEARTGPVRPPLQSRSQTIFFKRQDIGEYRLYHPVVDGPSPWCAASTHRVPDPRATSKRMRPSSGSTWNSRTPPAGGDRPGGRRTLPEGTRPARRPPATVPTEAQTARQRHRAKRRLIPQTRGDPQPGLTRTPGSHTSTVATATPLHRSTDRTFRSLRQALQRCPEVHHGDEEGRQALPRRATISTPGVVSPART